MTLGSGPRITTNHTEILITDIGENATRGLPSLTCHTDLTTCCRSVADNNGTGPLGQWTYPDGSVVLGRGASFGARQQLYTTRNATQLIRLARRQAQIDHLSPTGPYCCTIPTTRGNITLCVNLGEWITQLSPYPISPSHSGVSVPPSPHQWSDLLL